MAEPFVGEIRMFAGTWAPADWALCDGSLLQISANQLLYTVLGTTYGGDGQTTFGLPDLRGRVPVSQGQGPGLTYRAAGAAGGTETVPLAEANLPAHTHLINVSQSVAATNTVGSTVTLAAVKDLTPGQTDALYLPAGKPAKNSIAFNAAAVTSAGGSLPHDNVMPGLAVTFIIALVGIFPQQ